MKEIYSQTTFYHAMGRNDPNPIFIRVTLDAEINREVMQRAIDSTIARYPYLRVKLGVLGERLVLEDNPEPVKLYSDITLISELNGGYLFRFAAKGAQLTLVSSHALMDGATMEWLMSTLLYEYYKRLGSGTPDPDGIRIPGEGISPEEYTDPLTALTKEEMDSAVLPAQADFYKLPDVPDKTGRRYVYRFSAEEKPFMDAVKELGGSPNALMAFLFARAIDRACSVLPEEEIQVGVAVNVKKILGKEKSYISCVNMLPLSYNENLKEMKLSAAVRYFRSEITKQCSRESIAARHSVVLRSNKYISSLPTLAEKSRTARNLIANAAAIGTVQVSYLGQFGHKGISEHILRMDVISHSNATILEFVSVNGRFDFTLDQAFANDNYARALMQLLEELGISCTYLGEEKMEPVGYEPI